MNIPVWLVSSIVSGSGIVAFFSFRYVLSLIKDSNVQALKERVILRKEMKELRRELHTRMSSSEVGLRDAIDKLTSGVVPKSHCEGKQEIWTERFEHLLNTIKTEIRTEIKMVSVEIEIQSKADVVLHGSINDTLLEFKTEINDMKKVIGGTK